MTTVPVDFMSLAVEVCPDCSAIRNAYALPSELSDAEVSEYALQRMRASRLMDSLPPYLQRVATVSVVAPAKGLRVFGGTGWTEQRILQAVAAALSDGPEVVTWSESRLRILLCRALFYKVSLRPLFSSSGMEFSAWVNVRKSIDSSGLQEEDFESFCSVIDGSESCNLAASDRDLGHLACVDEAVKCYSIWLRYLLVAGCINSEEYESKKRCVL